MNKLIRIAQPCIGDAEIRAVEESLRSGMLAQGTTVALFEDKFAEYCNCKYAIAVNSGTSALHSALFACGVCEDDKVVTTPFTFVATANAILMLGAKPIFVDINETTLNINLDRIEESIVTDVKAILAVDLFGLIHDVEEVNRAANAYNLRIIEDACQSHGAEYCGLRAGTLGHVGCFSFYATKNITTGEGGMVTTNDESICEAVMRYRHHGQNHAMSYEYVHLGYNYRMTEMEAAIGIEQLKRLDSFVEKRIRNAEMYNNGLADVRGIITPAVKNNYKHVFNQYTVRITDEFRLSREKLAIHLREKGIETAIYYPKPLHLHKHFMELGYNEGDFPVAEQASRQVLSLPVHPLVSEENIEYIIASIKEVS